MTSKIARFNPVVGRRLATNSLTGPDNQPRFGWSGSYTDTARSAPGHIDRVRGFWALCQRIGAERKSLKPAFRFALRGLLHMDAVNHVAQSLGRLENGSMCEDEVVHILLNLGRPYARRGLSPLQRAAIMVTHHTVFSRHLGIGVKRGLSERSTLCLARISGRAGGPYRIVLKRSPFSLRKEGEATLSLVDDSDGVSLADLTFSIGPDTLSGRPCLRIGGMQGPKSADAREAIKTATKALSGLRPKAAVIEAFYVLARQIGVDRILATSLKGHVLTAKRGRGQMHSSAYDGFWEELGAVRQNDYEFSLPGTLPHRPECEVPSNRRSEWRRRQALVADLVGQTHEALTRAPLGVSASPTPVRLSATFGSVDTLTMPMAL